MNMQSRLTTMLLALALALVLAVPGVALAYSEESPMILKCGIDNPPQDMKSQTIKRLGDLVEERTNGRIQFKYFYGASLIKKPQFIDAVGRGIADISTGPVSFVTGKIPELSIFEIYGSWQLDKFIEMQAAIEPTLIELLEQHKVRPLMLQYNGTTIFAHKSKFLKEPADWQGQKMRLPGRWLSTLGKDWGASPVFMPPPELYLASQRGVIDGYMLIYDIINGLKLYEVTPYLTDTDFSNNIEVITMNLKKWNELTDADREIFQATIEEVKPWTYVETLKYYEALKADMVKKGAKIYALTPAEKSRYLKDAHALYPQIREASGPIGVKFMDIMEAFRDQ